MPHTSALTELADYLESLGVGIQAPQAGANLYIGQLPDKPDTVLVLYTYPGGAPEYVQNSYAPIAERPQIQVVTRALHYHTAEALAWSAWIALSPITNRRLGTTYYRSVRPEASPAVLTRDSNDRPLLFFNVAVNKEVSVGARS